MTTILLPPVGPLSAARAYLLDELDARDNSLPVGVVAPQGEPECFALLSRPGGATRTFLADYLIRIRVFDKDAVRLEDNTELLHRLMLHASRKQITVGDRTVWITGATSHIGPIDFDDPDVPMFGMQCAVFWTIGLLPEVPAPTPGS